MHNYAKKKEKYESAGKVLQTVEHVLKDNSLYIAGPRDFLFIKENVQYSALYLFSADVVGY